ncbi:lipase family protein [Streptococcus macacae]|uniref:Triacylglycerol lipase domain protein n=1 Tax=Streptococcus macacae NCTC 11558 TaxID=764298 RepID=G5JXV8_9STRE|nr:triacylglycerol lipase [Streptococcus macacae]EHJ52304.1 triacylglycerol lipase domain protein [Streptococcus macacae NCTC 11558]SUN77880.1 Uncharacterised protein [Streptococcus macacae NCTC 11558]
MTNWNLENFDSIYASLAESAYTTRPDSFAMSDLKADRKKRLEDGESVRFDFSQDVKKDGQVTQGGQHFDSTDPNNDGIVYLQPDQKGLLEDKESGYNAYYLSENETINQDTHQTYFVVRGSDGMGVDTLNDWINNDARFALTDDYIPQAKLANKAMKAKIAELEEKVPKAKMNVTGHSLGTIVSAQAVANLSYDELDSCRSLL